MVLQTYFLIFLALAGILAAFGWLFRAQIKRARRYFLDWAESDRRAEEQAKAEVVQRAMAEAELREKLVEEEPEIQVQKVKM